MGIRHDLKEQYAISNMTSVLVRWCMNSRVFLQFLIRPAEVIIVPHSTVTNVGL